jgi:hypothetical protein
MQTINKITLPQPCHEPWTNMRTVTNGRFCGSCNKAVIDFTTMTNQQIIDHLSASTGNVCGRIAASQFNDVNNQLLKPAPTDASIWKHIMLTFTLLTSLAYAKGQTGTAKVNTEQTQVNLITGEIVAIADKPVKYIMITGIIKDNKGEPLQQATVIAGNQSTLTNIAGAFKLRVPEGTKSFEVKYIGMETATININKKQGKPYQINMKAAGIYLGGIGAIKRPNKFKAFYENYIVKHVKALIA